MNTGGTTDLAASRSRWCAPTIPPATWSNGVPSASAIRAASIVKAKGEPTVYHMGDTDIFSDMALIAEIHRAEVAMVPIGDRFTMSPTTAALAVKRFFKLDAVIPCHYGSFPIIEPTRTSSWRR